VSNEYESGNFRRIKLGKSLQDWCVLSLGRKGKVASVPTTNRNL